MAVKAKKIIFTTCLYKLGLYKRRNRVFPELKGSISPSCNDRLDGG